MFSEKWNFDHTDENVLVCRGDHEKGDGCQYEAISPREIVEIIQILRSKVLETATKLETIARGLRQ